MSHATVWTPYRPPGRIPSGRPRFNQKNFLGRRCVFAWYAGLAGSFAAECPGDALRTRIHNLGVRQAEFTHKQWGNRTIAAENGLFWGVTPLSSGIVYRQINARTAHLVWTAPADFNIAWKDPQAVTLVAIFKTDGNGSDNAVYDPRIVSKDSGVFEQDHHYMLGGVKTGAVDAGGPTEARTRMKIGGTTTTLVLNTPTWQADAMNLSAVTYDGSTLALHLLREDGQRGRASQAQSGDLSISDVTAILGIGGTADGDDNFFGGDIHAILAFDGAFDDVQILQQLFYNWTQIFEPTWVHVSAVDVSGIIKNIEETVAFQEGTARLRTLNRLANETVNQTENALNSLVLLRTLTESLSLNEQVDSLRDLVRTADENISYTEQVIKSLTGLLIKVVDENWAISETVQRELALLLVKIANEAISVQEALLRVRKITRNVQEIEQVTESKNRLLGLYRLIGEVQEIAENVRAPKGLTRIILEAENLVESITKARSITVMIDETLSFVEAVRRGVADLGSLVVDAFRIVSRLKGAFSSKSRLDGTSTSKSRLDADVDINKEDE